MLYGSFKLLIRSIFFIFTLISMVACMGSSGSGNANGGNNKSITSFSISNYEGQIQNNTINITLPSNTNLTSLVANFTTTGSYVTVNGVKQTSGVTTNDFTNPIVYTVYAANGSTYNYTVTVQLLPLAYVVSSAGSPTAIDVCEVNFDGTLSNCLDSGATGLNFSLSLAIDQSNKIIYVTNYGGSTVTSCKINADNSLSCNNSSATLLASPAAIVLNPNVAKTYIGNNSNSNLVSCNRDGNGNLGNCTIQILPSAINSLAINSGGTYLYASIGSTIQVCTLANDGHITVCGDSGFTTTANILGLAVNSSNGDVFVSVGSPTNLVYKCVPNSNDGTLSNCVDTGISGLTNPASMSLNQSNSTLYLINNGVIKLLACPINNDGSIGTCTNTNAVTPYAPKASSLYYRQ